MADKLTYQELLDAGVHFGHLTRKWNPKMAEYIFMENNGIHIIDLNKTLAKLDEATFALKNIVRSGRKIMFVATKKAGKRYRYRRSEAIEHAVRYRALAWRYADKLCYHP